MKAVTSVMPGSNVDYVILVRLCMVNLAGMSIPTDKAETEAF